MFTIIDNKDIFDLNVQAVVNPVNCVGVCGKGLALEFKNKFPINFKSYKRACENGDLVPGTVFYTEIKGEYPQYIFNLATKGHWSQPSLISYIRNGVDNLVHKIKRLKIESIAIPALGCGLGGLDFRVVRNIVRFKVKKGCPSTIVWLIAPQKET